MPKTVSDNESEYDSDTSHSVIPNPPDFTDKSAVQSVDRISNVFNSSVINDISMEVLDGTIVSHKSNYYFISFIYLLLLSL